MKETVGCEWQCHFQTFACSWRKMTNFITEWNIIMNIQEESGCFTIQANEVISWFTV
jgi:hypothetical protein